MRSRKKPPPPGGRGGGLWGKKIRIPAQEISTAERKVSELRRRKMKLVWGVFNEPSRERRVR